MTDGGTQRIKVLIVSYNTSPEEGNPGLVLHNASKNRIFLSFYSTVFSIILLIVSWLQYGYSTFSLMFTYQARRTGKKITVAEGKNVVYPCVLGKPKFPQDSTLRTFTDVF